jgi:uncharacterized protein (TIGR00304 family)
MKLVVFGFLLIFVGLALLLTSVPGSNVSTGGFVLIGPIPIVFGSGTNGSPLAVLAVGLGIAMLLWLFALARRAKTESEVLKQK